MNGKFVISLDFELHWGLFDAKSIEDYKTNLQNTPKAISKILKLSDQYNVRLTFSIVGFLFNKNNIDLKANTPEHLPTYANSNFNPYPLIETIDKNYKTLSPYYFARPIIEKIAQNKLHEIGTHTYSHYYCLASGQTIDQFDSDIETAVKVSAALDIDCKSIIFPRNEVNNKYLDVCAKHGITSYRGTENAWPFKNTNFNKLAPAFRLLDSYFKIFGNHTYNIQKLKNNFKHCVNLPSSRFLRPYKKKLSFLEPLKLRRIKKAMTYAAKHNELYHLWWHPHNFGSDLNKNLEILTAIYTHYQELHKKYGFESETMTSLSAKLMNQDK
ncbi:polysaccharide deacetylase family protein [Algibacter miyuki]|uniref:Polysaccharide deacetylase family protein n=1 Tax=Algibacter miyuki TaxID=1306933 RepID=A0ABV5GYW6_9FLAO|nr:polysaccharide deacetylase family protein [Algibacter miyuki]MDN3667152.1 polysaccharide deacetylase family protein [Algibacter miyuki]